MKGSRQRAGLAASLPLTALLLAACSASPRRPAVPERQPMPPAPADLAHLPDAVPRAEPRSAHGNPPFYEVYGKRYQVLASSTGFVERGVASWYGPDFHGHSTSSGEPYDMYAMTAAHKTLPLPCYARITNLANGRSVVVRINDRGPFVANRIVDLSYSAALRLDLVRTGTGFVELRALGPGEDSLYAAAAPAGAATTTPRLQPAVQPAQQGVPGPEPVIVPPPVAAEPAGSGLLVLAPQDLSLYIQVGAYGDPANANRVLARLQAGGMPRAWVQAVNSNGRALQRVRIGPIASVADYDQLAARLATLGFPDARLATD
jgi:rare lipoprotein A